MTVRPGHEARSGVSGRISSTQAFDKFENLMQYGFRLDITIRIFQPR